MMKTGQMTKRRMESKYDVFVLCQTVFKVLIGLFWVPVGKKVGK